MTELEVAWLAGLLEGEGCFGRTLDKRNGLSSVYIQCNMTDEDVINRIASITKVGSVFPTQRPGKKWKQQWRWKTCATNAVEIMEAVLPFMGERRSAKIEELVALHKKDRAQGKVLQAANLVRMTQRCKEVLTGKPKSEEHRAKISEAGRRRFSKDV